MTPKIRVLVVDDSVVVRRLVTDVLSEQPDIVVVGTASNGRVALARLEQATPDLVTLDVEMPELDGLATLAEIRKRFRKLPVIMFSTTTRRAAAATIEALTLGANDYVTKPEGAGSIASAREKVAAELVPKIRALCGRSTTIPMPMGTPSATPITSATSSGSALAALHAESRHPVTAIAIGVSTGGPPALEKVLSALPKTLSVPVFIVQHMPPMFTALLATRLAQHCALPVTELEGTTKVEPGHVYLAPGDQHMVVEAGGGTPTLHLNHDAPENSCRPAVDVLFRSVAQVYGAGTLAVVLTGMGSDGTRGAEQIRARGGVVVAQDQASSVVWGMPGSVVRANLATIVVPLDNVARELIRRVTTPLRPRAAAGGH